MATITFKAKAVREIFLDATREPTGAFIIQAPRFTRKHCDMPAFRKHGRFGGFANSDLFPNVLERIRRDTFPHGHIRTDAIPANVKIDLSGFLAVVTVEV